MIFLNLLFMGVIAGLFFLRLSVTARFFDESSAF
jgi:hypothetical protein